MHPKHCDEFRHFSLLNGYIYKHTSQIYFKQLVLQSVESTLQHTYSVCQRNVQKILYFLDLCQLTPLHKLNQAKICLDRSFHCLVWVIEKILLITHQTCFKGIWYVCVLVCAKCNFSNAFETLRLISSPFHF